MITPDLENLPELGEIDLYDPERYRTSSQHPAWHTLRLRAPVWPQSTPDGDRFWSVTRFHDVSTLLMDDKRFSSAYGTILAVAKGDIAAGKTINLMDQPDHAGVRLPAMRTMSTRVARDRKEAVRRHVRRVLGSALDGGTVDFAELAAHLPLAAVGDIVGIPESAWPGLPRLAMAGVAPGDPSYSAGAESDTLTGAHFEIFAMFTELVRERRRRRRDDLISVLLDADLGGRRLSEHELVLNCYSFLMGAVTTTPQVAAHLIQVFIDQPGTWRRVRQDPALVPTAVEEALRWASPTNHLMRRARCPVRLGGTLIDEGDLVCGWVAAANRDETVFAEPYAFDPARQPNPHLAFGVGAHRCIGGPPAQVVLAVLLEELCGRVDEIVPAGAPVHMRSNFINGITSLPVEFRPGGRSERVAAGAATVTR
ncbi:cytochrome P450 [Paractinoplanes rishiriensis]|uniref:Cytochrome P450 n=1 Tax=Paractinoplanes rishiriensis TaxID=1050105 RepID=A0A919K4R4_9ACTN|nr:cytochrome P450 [Actinoplanes rishiriensis]GIE99524.1 cytochrome P450 [Actinoplanes rishiriensis]